jgi:pimeloyl-ACP methyl ester carboxylesterase
MHRYVNARFERVVVPGAGHFVHVEQPEAFNSAVRAFVGTGH